MENPLGRGGMGAVYRVFDTSTNTSVALKRLINTASRKHVALFEREYHTLAGLSHPRVVQVYEYGADRHGPYYTMELLSGGDVARLAPLGWREVCRILRDVASALTLLHARRLVHRDVNPCNVWRTPEGDIKLIDFGALAAFGHVDYIAGTAPMIPPEALYGALDQRSDLYALGALGYWLLTGTNAYPVNDISQLKHAFRQPVRPPSAWVAELSREDLEAPPAALDELLLSLLSQNPMARPANGAELVHRLTNLAELAPDTSIPVAEAYLRSAAFVSREQVLAQLSAALEAARAGHGSTVMVEGTRGVGRTRLLTEFGVRAGLSGATVLHVAGEAHSELGGTAHACACKLLDVLPELALSTAQPYAASIGHLSAAVRERLGLTPGDLAPMPHTPGEARMRVHSALQAWFLDTCRAQPVVLLVDDLHRVDPSSLAWLAGLSQLGAQAGLLLVASLREGADADPSTPLKVLRRSATEVVLTAFEEGETLELLRSIFGDAPHLERLCGRVHRFSQGNPAQTMELAEHLVRKGVVTYADASWILPQELDPGHLPETHVAALMARLQALSAQTRAVARTLSVVSGRIPLEHCAALVEQGPAALFAALAELTREGVLASSGEGYSFVHEAQRMALLGETSQAARARVHARLAEVLLSSGQASASVRLEAAVHGMLGEERADAPCGRYGALAVGAGLDVVLHRQHELDLSVPFLEQALQIFRAAKRPPHEMAALLSPLAVGAYYADRRLGEVYGDDAVQLLEGLLRLRLARRLRPWLGARLGLYIALLVAAVGFIARRFNPRVPRFKDCVMLLFNTAAALAGSAGLCIDPKRAARYARVLEPLCALGKNHAATLTYTLAMNAADTVTDRLDEVRERWRVTLARIEEPRPIRALPSDVRHHFHVAALYGYGIVECYRDGGGALEIADRLEGFGMKLYEMSADQLRTVYYAMQGNTQLSERYRRRVEMHALSRGNSWQVEAWLPGPMITLYLRTHDAAGMRRQVRLLERLHKEIPSLDVYLTRALGAYLLLCGRYEEALPYLECGLSEEPQARIGWARGYGVMARALHALGQYARAKEVCEQALARMRDGDLDYCATNLGVAVEHARAEAGLGNLEVAARRLDALIARFAPQQGPLTLGALHEARAEVAQQAGDGAALSHHLAEMVRWYRKTDVPELLRRCDRVEPTGQRKESPPSADRQTRQNILLQGLRLGGGRDASAFPSWLLSQVCEAAGVGAGYLFLLRDDTLIELSSLEGEKAPDALMAWVREQLQAVQGDPKTTVILESAAVDSIAKYEVDGKRYELHVLPGALPREHAGLSGLVVESTHLSKEVLTATLLRVVAARLIGVLKRAPNDEHATTLDEPGRAADSRTSDMPTA